MNRILAALAFCLADAFGALPASAGTGTAIFAGGCFWCVESDFDNVPGVTATTSGYIGGTSANPTYADYHDHGHREAVRIEFDTDRTSYAQLLHVFFRAIDPTDPGGQFCDRGHAYSSAVYVLDDAQKTEAEAAKAEAAQALKTEIATEILAAPEFWPAEEYHQDYHLKHTLKYRFYRYNCGRDARIEEVWGSEAHDGIAEH